MIQARGICPRLVGPSLPGRGGQGEGEGADSATWSLFTGSQVQREGRFGREPHPSHSPRGKQCGGGQWAGVVTMLSRSVVSDSL